eukprot:c21876_g1_i1.p1 GENE.c21876_g1_i1~~c21876_g1_i1.p1  ORF type:complete len:309 (-),score=90.38 c21876_g1_i1:23-949(-)
MSSVLDFLLFAQSSDPLTNCLGLFVFLSIVVFLVQEATQNYGQIDKLWSIAPAIYAGLFLMDKPQNSLLQLMFFCVVCWSVRLTYNFSRKGGFSWPPWKGEPDYRWVYVRQLFPSQILWLVFSFVYVSVLQNLLLLQLVLPMSVVHTYSDNNSAPSNIDILIALSFLGVLIIETIADNQQYAFQTEKYRRKKDKLKLEGDYKKGFLTSGLFSYSRHPNYAAEQTMWFIFYLFSCSITNQWLVPNGSIGGFLFLVLIFLGSVWLTERISCGKYPEYKVYQSQVPSLIPSFILWPVALLFVGVVVVSYLK